MADVTNTNALKGRHMNQARRKQLAEALAIVETIRDEEQDSFQNLPESFQDGERGDLMQETIDDLDEAATQIQNSIER